MKSDQGDALGHDKRLWPLKHPHRAPRQDCHVGLLREGKTLLKGMAVGTGDEAKDGERAFNRLQQIKLLTDLSQTIFLERRSSSLYRRQDPAVEPVQHYCPLDEGSIAWQ